MGLLSRKATCNSHGQDSSYFLGWQEYEKNPYHQLHNPKGIIQMGLAENQLSFDLLESWLAKNPDAVGCKRDGQFIFRELALFQDYHGLPAFKKALVDFMAEIRGNKVTFDPNHIVLTAGATSANETIMFCLAEQRDAFLLPTPYYPGLSKDLGLPGFRVGAIYSNNPTVVAAATKMSSFGLVSSQTQYLLSVMLSDNKFRNNYIAKNQKRLQKRQRKLVSGLEKADISCLESNAGLFCWVDMRHMLSSNTFEAEMQLWERIVYDVKLNISPGSSCHCSEPGWFRVCFANMSEDTLKLAMQRLKSFVNPITSSNKKSQPELKNLRKESHRFEKWITRLSHSFQSFHDREQDKR
ncbi:hypothetical protein V6N11_040135 [Hibiscus sabdariffa]|uniref:1-aminocyclopropane-1-carboxylate synthase n=1 Tax=Hibiscus sabdariffa TaxID=183260 RepID=A0ABR2RGU4_9ROSI